ncbi:MAG: hypothetical protein JXL84_10635 [Deltaproteobacteria bacterium]|nr:hypothetical protein [Deltaproteobacteria bacterium]
MSNQTYIKTVLRGAELYREQGLYAEAKEKYLEVLSFLERDRENPNAPAWRKTLEARLQEMENTMDFLEKDHGGCELEETKQNLIKNLFSFSASREMADLEGAVALWKFGQHRRALSEFEKLLEEGIQPLAAAKYIILCLLTLSSPESAIARFKKWSARGVFSEPEVQHLKDFLSSEFRMRGLEVDLPPVDVSSNATGGKEDLEPQISTITIDFESGRLKGQSAEMSVTFQFGNVLSVLVSALKKDLVEALRPGAKFPRVGLFSPMAFFRGAGVVVGRTMVKHGPTRGDYLIDITIEEG